MDLSIVIPLLNEEESLRPLFQKIQDAVGDLGLSYEAIFIDDGSTDQSMAVLRELREKSDAVKIIRFRRNFGKAAAYSAAFSRVRGKYVITMDADLQDDPAEIANLIAKLEE
ncbi:TPA: glycosyltransferase, partial [Candidatus Latescibacteria bacterium]|nr:glycosyltransferase [Candidatus Latescibacterota bacterium]